MGEFFYVLLFPIDFLEILRTDTQTYILLNIQFILLNLNS